MRLLLTLVDGEEIDYKMDKDSVSIGRSAKCDLVIPHESMSRNHCQIEIKDGEFFITDLGSINGVYIDNVKIPANSSVPFQTFLHLAFGYVTSAQIVVDEATKFGVLVPKSGIQNQTTGTGPISRQENKTRTKTLSTQKTKTTNPKATPTKSSGKNTLAINLLAFIGILAGLYYFLYADQETAPSNSTQPQGSAKPTDTSDHF